MNAAETSRETSQTLDRGLRVLEVLAEASGGLTVAEVAVRVGAPRTAAYRLVATLEAHGFVRRGADGRVRMGLGVLRLASRAQPLLREAAVPALRRLAEDLGATAHLTVAEGSEALAIAVVEPSWTQYHVAYRVGSRHQIGNGAAGKAILLLRPGAGTTAGTGTSAGEPAAFATSEGELQPGAHGLAAPVRDVPGLEASVGVVSLTPLDPDRAGPRVVRAAAEVAAGLR